ncbi:MAG TPA: hypothetical protein VNO32_52565, partial [Candidatus Acidoferrum sp.]|nr:hypothetical protein [Candidatus Acidoferrum sp.]
MHFAESTKDEHNFVPELKKEPFGMLTSFCRETQNTTLNQAFGGFSHYFFLDKYVWLMAHMHS